MRPVSYSDETGLILSNKSAGEDCWRLVYTRNNSVTNTTIHAITDTWNKLRPNHASRIAATNAMAAATGFWVAVMIAGNVITDKVT